MILLVEWRMAMVDAGPVSRRVRQHAGGIAHALQRPDLDGIVNRIFGFDGAEPSPPPAAPPKTRNFDVALDALRRGAATLEDLQLRCARLQSELAASAERHRSELDEAHQELCRWQMIATDLGGKVQHVQAQLAEAERQGELHAELAEAERRRADAAERRSLGVERITLAFRDSLLDVIQDEVPSGS